MSYDPNRTNMMPDMGSSFPITDELPAVRGPHRGGPLWLKVLAVLLVAAIGAIAAILVVDNQRSDQVATGGDPTPTADSSDSDSDDDDAAPTVTELDDVEPGFWQVVDVAQGLNVRSGPGTDSNVIGALAADSRFIFATGERATVNGAEWTQITFGPDDTVGWVSARFLAPDTEPPDDLPTPTAPVVTGTSVVCFRSEGPPERIARLVFTNGTDIQGQLRTISGSTVTDQTVTGTLDNGRASMTLVDEEADRATTQTWTFAPASVNTGGGRTMRVVQCSTIASSLG